MDTLMQDFGKYLTIQYFNFMFKSQALFEKMVFIEKLNNQESIFEMV